MTNSHRTIGLLKTFEFVFTAACFSRILLSSGESYQDYKGNCKGSTLISILNHALYNKDVYV